MTQIEKIRAEIERLINDKTDGKHVAEADITAPKRSAYLDILNFINSLPAEQPSENLEEEIESYLTTNRQYAGGDEEDLWCDDCIRDAIKHGANWQKEKLIKKAYLWLQHNAEKYVASYGLPNYQTGLLLHDFKHVMEDN